jgi:hypothetical protein
MVERLFHRRFGRVPSPWQLSPLPSPVLPPIQAPGEKGLKRQTRGYPNELFPPAHLYFDPSYRLWQPFASFYAKIRVRSKNILSANIHEFTPIDLIRVIDLY